MPSRVASPAVQSKRGHSQGPCTDAVYADTKCFYETSGVVAVAAGYNSTIWLAMQDGLVEVRDAHTGQPLHEFAVAHTRQQKRNKVWCMLAVYDVINQEAQMWMGLSSGGIEVYTENYQLRRHLSKHLSGVYCLAQHRGAVVYAGSSDFTITQWRVHDGQLLRVMTGHANYVRCLYAEGNALISGSDDNTIRVWDVATGSSLQHYTHLHRESGGVSALCRVGTAMWSGDHSGAVAVWRLKDGAALLVCRQLSSRVTSLRKFGAHVYAGSAEGRICVFNAGDCTVVSWLDDHRGSSVSAIACAVEVDRYFVWSSSADNTVRCWHHDEHQPMTADREGLLDMRWYYTTQRPYLQANEELLEQHREASELVVLSSGSDEAVREFLEGFGEGRETAAARYWLQDTKVRQVQKKCDAAEKEARALEAAAVRKTQTLSLLKDQLSRLTEALQTARCNQPAAVLAPAPALGPSAPGITVAGVPSVLPAVPPPPPSAAVTTVPPLTDAPATTATTTAASTVASPAASAQALLPSGTTPLPALPPGVTVPVPPPSSTVPAPPTAAVPAPPPPAAAVPVPPPPTVVVPVPTLSASPSPPRVITETHVTHSRSYEPVLGALPPPPPATGPKKTLGLLLRMGSSSSSTGGGGGGDASSPSPSLVTAVPLPPVVVVPPPPPPTTMAVVVPSRPATVKTPPDTPTPKPAAPLARRMSF
jgi:WD40 repeat protein